MQTESTCCKSLLLLSHHCWKLGEEGEKDARSIADTRTQSKCLNSARDKEFMYRYRTIYRMVSLNNISVDLINRTAINSRCAASSAKQNDLTNFYLALSSQIFFLKCVYLSTWYTCICYLRKFSSITRHTDRSSSYY